MVWKTSKQRSYGHSLIEVMVALGLFSIIGIGSATFYQWIHRSTGKLDRTNEVEELHGRVSLFIRDHGQCSSALAGVAFNANPINIAVLRDRNGAVAFQTGVPIPPKNLRIISMQLANFRVIETHGILERGIANLNLIYRDPKINEVADFQRSIPLLVTRDTTTTKIVSQCGDLPFENWFLQGGGSTNIYSLLPIAIGTTTPNANSSLETARFPVNIGNQNVGGIRLQIDRETVGGTNYNTLTTTPNASLRFIQRFGGPWNLLTFNNGKMGFFTNPPFNALMEFSPSPQAAQYGYVLTSGSDWEGWNFWPTNSGNDFVIRRIMSGMWSGAPTMGNIVIYGGLAVDPGSLGAPAGAAASKFWVNGNAGGSSAWWNPSDRTLKSDLQKIPKAGEKIDALRPVTYELKRSLDHRRQVGFIAQEVQTVLPELVTGDEGSLGLKLDQVIAVLVEAIKETDEAINTNTSKLEHLLNSICEKHPNDEVCLNL